MILAIGLGAMLVGVSAAMRSDVRTQMNRTAMHVAQSRLEAAGVTETLILGRREGRSGNGYSWQQTVTAVQSAAAPGDQAADKQRSPASSSVSAYWVEVAVRAEDGATAELRSSRRRPSHDQHGAQRKIDTFGTSATQRAGVNSDRTACSRSPS